jgi:hypothetical protein
MGLVDWYIRYFVVPIAALTLFGMALAIFFFFWPLGVVAFFFAAMLFEQLLLDVRSKKPGIGDRARTGE